MKKIIAYSFNLLFLVTFLASCLGDLDTMPLDNNQLVSDQVYKTKDGYTGVLAKCYSSLILTGQQGGDGGNGDLEGANEGYSGYVRLLFYLQEMSTDNFLMPSSSNGLRKCLNLQWDASNASVVTWTYQRLYMSIAYCNELLRECTEGKLQDRGLWEEMKDEYIGYRAEARFIRAYCYSMLCDLFGSVPYVDEHTGVKEIPVQYTRKQIFEYAESELLAVENELKAPGENEYGRIDRVADWFLLARMYLNAGVYTGTPMWNECLEQCNDIINSGLFSLETNYTDIFKTENSGCVETIFAIPYDEVYNEGDNNGPVFGAHMKFLSSNSRKVFNMQTTPWGGSAANPQFINSYDPDDMRLKYTWLQGDQYSPDGVLITTFPNKLPSIYKTDTDDGYRVGKYEIKVGAKSLLSNDFPYFRYTEVLLMKAECLLRLGQNETEAAHIVSQIRERAFRESAHPEKATVDAAWLKGDTHINYGTLDEKGQIDDAGNTEVVELGGLYDEWGWEFAAEARRRTDMIRFGTYQKKSWFNHTPTANDLNGNSILFPIHLDHLNTNPNLQQNPGYAGK